MGGLQTILGAGGVIGLELARCLTGRADRIRLVSRNPRAVNPGDELFAADLADPGRVLEAVRGSEVVYLTAGLPYDIRVWRARWPLIMRNTMDACERENARLVFFDNVYLYGRVDGSMTEETPANPCSRKGEVRAAIAARLMEAAKRGRLRALIARSADFYGPGARSFASVPVLENLAKGRKPQWMVDAGRKHSLTYTPDAGRSTALLGNTESAYGQVWHLPTARPPLTGAEFIALCCEAFGRPAQYSVLSRPVIVMAGLFIRLIRESVEMLYQNERDYLFDSSKFERAFDVRATPYREGVAATVAAMR